MSRGLKLPPPYLATPATPATILRVFILVPGHQALEEGGGGWHKALEDGGGGWHKALEEGGGWHKAMEDGGGGWHKALEEGGGGWHKAIEEVLTTSPLHSRGSPNTWGTKSELVGPTIGRKCYITPAFSGFPKERGTKSELDA